MFTKSDKRCGKIGRSRFKNRLQLFFIIYACRGQLDKNKKILDVLRLLFDNGNDENGKLVFELGY